ncbi:hypothetical protein ANCCEY_03250 [Ancylostoma ceylanicum]|uniref:Uncharacterized protein n=1 Tax=Ancylostoma ceylanicum TaxID=53326 RepID=A0A0D6M0P7_9BILA|nr:hypothetical protein ANCCEY_03250 [Ancylostoma ceylanicum]
MDGGFALALRGADTGPASESAPPIPDTLNTRYYELDAEKLKDLWHNAMIRGLIKALSRELLLSLPRIENVVYQQCENGAKSTVALAKCAVRVFDARDNARKKEKDARFNEQKLVTTISARRRSKPVWQWQDTSGLGSQFIEEEHQTQYILRSSEYKFRNPIRKQIRRNGGRTNTPSMRASPNIRKSNAEMKETARRLTLTRVKRRRKSLNDEISTGASLNLRKLAMKYLRNVLGEPLGTSHLEKLRLLRDHFKRVEKINNYFKHMNDQNRRLFAKSALPIDSRTPEITNSAVPAIEQVLAIVNTFASSKDAPGKVSVLSPRVLSLFPESSRPSSKRLLSPTFFSFQKDGYLSLPELFDIITTDQKYQQLMVDVIMDISGAGDVLEKFITDMKPEMEDLKNVKLPLIEELSRRDIDWMRLVNELRFRVHDSFNDAQTRQYNANSYAFLNEDQLNLIYSKDDQQLYGMNITKLGLMTDDEKSQRLERGIRELAALDRPKWPMWDEVARPVVKREAHEASHTVASTTSLHGPAKSTGLGEASGEERVNGVLYETFRPFAFTTIVSRGGAMEAVTLSPHAFLTEVANPEALVLQTLSPRAFVASILSPAALIARILSPTALRAEVLSPRALHTWILSPEALVAEVLSPRFFDPRVLSPEALVIDVLSPGFLSPHVLSSESGGLIILSPNILSPRVASEEKLLVEILSPHILGGPHTHEEASHEVVEIGSHSAIRESTEQEHEEHLALHRGRPHSHQEPEPKYD